MNEPFITVCLNHETGMARVEISGTHAARMTVRQLIRALDMSITGMNNLRAELLEAAKPSH